MVLGIACSLFIQKGSAFVNFLLFSLGIVFSLSILFMEIVVSRVIIKFFKYWTVGKAIFWYGCVFLFAGATNFLYKSILGGFNEFNISEFIYVVLRTAAISFTVVFIIIGMYQFFNRRRLSGMIVSETNFEVTTSDGKSVSLDLNAILYIVSDDNYVDVHYFSKDQTRAKLVLRSSLKNIENQIVNPISPIQRCHRKYLIHVKLFEVEKATSRSMTLSLKNYSDKVPVSSQHVKSIREFIELSK